MKQNPPILRDGRNFGLLFAGLFLVISGIGFFKGSTWWVWSTAAGALFLATGLAAPAILAPAYRWWMKFAAALGWLNTRVILTVVFLLIFAPVGLILRLFRRDLLHQRFDRRAGSYWMKRRREPFNAKRYEQMF